jgi:hypothetical protein
LALWVDEWWDLPVLVWLAAITGAAVKAAAGRTNASAANRRLYDEVTSVCSGGKNGAKGLTVGYRFLA